VEEIYGKMELQIKNMMIGTMDGPKLARNYTTSKNGDTKISSE
jgi:hypothetical protein